MKMKSGFSLLMLAIAAPFAVFGIYAIINKQYSRLPSYGNLENRTARSVSYFGQLTDLHNQDGRTVALAKDGKIKIVNFFFTNCPVICPKMTGNLKMVQSSIDTSLISIVSFSIDPERDSTSVLKTYSRLHKIDNGNWALVTGEKSTIYGLARNNFTVVAGDGGGDADDFIHSELVVLVDRANNIRGYYSGTKTKDIKKLIADIKKLYDEN